MAKTADAHRAKAGAGRFIAVIESRKLVREVICRALQSAFSLRVVAYATASELEGQFRDGSVHNIMRKLKVKNRTEVAIKAQSAVAIEHGRGSEET